MDKYIIENEKNFLKGKLKGCPLTADSKNKFDHKGKPLAFPGCSIISKIPLKSDLFHEIKLLQLKYKDLSPEKSYTYLPETSFHITLFDCCNVNTINTQYWPQNIVADNNYTKTAYELSKRIQNYIFPDKFDLKVNNFFVIIICNNIFWPIFSINSINITTIKQSHMKTCCRKICIGFFRT